MAIIIDVTDEAYEGVGSISEEFLLPTISLDEKVFHQQELVKIKVIQAVVAAQLLLLGGVVSCCSGFFIPVLLSPLLLSTGNMSSDLLREFWVSRQVFVCPKQRAPSSVEQLLLPYGIDRKRFEKIVQQVAEQWQKQSERHGANEKEQLEEKRKIEGYVAMTNNLYPLTYSQYKRALQDRGRLQSQGGGQLADFLDAVQSTVIGVIQKEKGG